MSTSGDSEAAPRPRRRLLPAGLVLGCAVLAALVSWPLSRALSERLNPRDLPDLGQVPAFELVDERGQPFTADDLAGRVWVASFIFTRCPSICPLLTARVREVQDRTEKAGRRVHLVSFTIDPDHDTPEILAAFAEAHGADPARWRFVTGDPGRVNTTIVQGFHVLVEGAGPDLVPETVTHGTHAILVDGAGRIRAYRDTSDDDGVDELVRDALRLARELPEPPEDRS